ncbi:MAG: hypothetical protein JO179_14085, partial [Solirubrobacterales bacterium]|nr:hypothetical protein [Solirubrobacterales bacterium]
ALTDGFALAFIVAAGFAVVGVLVAALALPKVPSRAAASESAAASGPSRTAERPAAAAAE